MSKHGMMSKKNAHEIKLRNLGFVHITFICLGAELRASGLNPSSAPLINIYSYHKLGDTGSDKQLMERIWTRRDITFV